MLLWNINLSDKINVECLSFTSNHFTAIKLQYTNVVFFFQCTKFRFVLPPILYSWSREAHTCIHYKHGPWSVWVDLSSISSVPLNKRLEMEMHGNGKQQWFTSLKYTRGSHDTQLTYNAPASGPFTSTHIDLMSLEMALHSTVAPIFFLLPHTWLPQRDRIGFIQCFRCLCHTQTHLEDVKLHYGHVCLRRRTENHH